MKGIQTVPVCSLKSRIEYCRGYAVKNKNKCKKKFIFLKKVLQKIESPRLENIHIYGRTGSQKMPLPLFWTGSGVEFLVTGTELWMEVEWC